MFRAPVDHFNTFAATVPSLSGLRAMQIGSTAGLRALAFFGKPEP
jgi:hypothetical protein